MMLAGCVIIPAKVAKRTVPGQAVEIEKPQIGIKPSGDNGGHYKVKVNPKRKQVFIFYEEEF